MPDAAFVMWGPIGREVITVMYFLFMVIFNLIYFINH